MKLFKIIRGALREMPWGIRFLALLCCWMSLSILVAIIPLPRDCYQINDEHISFLEFWRRGFGPLTLGIGCLAALVAYGFIRARRWSRILFVALVSGFLAFAIFAGGKIQWGAVVSGGCILVFVLWYFFCRRQVRDYFRENHDTAA
jgi:hypothetical protein